MLCTVAATDRKMEDEHVEFLVTLVREHPMLYHPTDPLHKDAERQRAVWTGIAETLGMGSGKCK